MNITALIIRVTLLGLPGIIASRLYRSLQGEPRGKDWESLLEIAIFSLVSYTLYGLGAELLGWHLVSFQALLDENIPLVWTEIAIASLIAVPLAFVGSLLHQEQLINRFGQWLKVTQRYGGVGIWQLFFSFPEAQEWVAVRDHKLELTYYGYIVAYSASEENKQLILGEVTVFDSNTSEPLYDSNTIYIARNRDDLTIEVDPKESSIDQKHNS